MQTAETSVHAINPMANPSLAHDRAAQENPTMLTHYQIIRRNGAVVPFEPAKIAVAMMKAFLAVHGTQGALATKGATTATISPLVLNSKV